MTSRIYIRALAACAILTALVSIRQAEATDRAYDGGAAGTGTDYYTSANWSNDAFPTAQFNARGIIGTTSVAAPAGLLTPTVTVSTTPTLNASTPTAQSGGLALGREATSVGTLNIVNGGTARFTQTATAGTAFTNGAVYLGEFLSGTGLAQGGIGKLDISGNGALIATGLFVEGETVGANRSSVTLSGSASVTLGQNTNIFSGATSGIGSDNLRLGRDLTITGPSVNFTNQGNLSFLSPSSYTANITSATGHSAIKSNGNVALAGTLTINFSGLVTNPAVGQTWNLIDYGGNLTGAFSNASIGNDVTVTGLPQPVALGAAFKLRKANGGTNGKLVQLVQQALLVLEVNRDSGELSITNPYGGAISIEGYDIRSPLGSLLSTYKGISGSPAGDSGWEKAPMNSTTGLAELKPTPFSYLNMTSIPSLTLGTGAGKGFDKFAIADDVAHFGTDGEDLTFFYDTPEGPLQGHVHYTGTKFENNLVLRVANDGTAFLKNDSHETLTLDGYTIRSTNAALSGGWSGLGAGWLKTNIAPDALSETNLFASLTIAAATEVPIGDIGTFATAAAQGGLSMEFILASALEGEAAAPAGDYTHDGIVDSRDYVFWRKTNVNGAQGYLDWVATYGQSAGAIPPEPASRIGSVVFNTPISGGGSGGGSIPAPEPGALWLLIMGMIGLLAVGRNRSQVVRGQFAYAGPSCRATRGQSEAGGRYMRSRFGSFVAVAAIGVALLSAQPAAAVPQGALLVNYDFESPGPVGVKTFAFDAAGVPVAGVIPGWTFTGPATEHNDPNRFGDSGTEGSGGLTPDNEMLLSVNDGKAYQVASGFTIQSITSNEIYKLAFDARDIFTVNSAGAGLADSGQLTARFFYGAWADGQRTLLNQVINLTGTETRYEFTIPNNSPLVLPGSLALSQTLGVEFTTTSKARNAAVARSYTHIDNVVMEIAPVLAGDFDGNGALTVADYNILAGNIARSACDTSPSGIRGCPFEADGEMTGDYKVDLKDFRAFKTAFSAPGSGGGGNATGAGGSTPEPSSGLMLLFAGAMIAAMKRSRSEGAMCVTLWGGFVSLVACVAALVAASSAQAELYTYDPFLLHSPLSSPAVPAAGEYNEWSPPTPGQLEPIGPHVPLAGQNTTPAFGTKPGYFQGAWRTSGNAPSGIVHPTGLSYATTTSMGGSARNAPVPNAAYTGPPVDVCGTSSGSLYSSCDGRTARFFSTPYTDTASESVYVSFFANFGTTAGTMGFRGVEFFPATSDPAGNWSEQRWLDLGYNEFNGYGVSTQTNPATAKLGLGLYGGNQPQQVLADAPTSYNADGRTHLFVLRFDFSSTNNMDAVFVYMDPASTDQPEFANAEFRNMNFTLGGLSTVTRYGGTAPGLDSIGAAGSSGMFDELRIGNLFADVLPPGLPVPGDTDGDLDVDLFDYATIKNNFHRTDASGPTQGDIARSDGRVGFDGKVDVGDFWLWKRKYEEAISGAGGSSSAPEPASAAMVFVAAAAAFACSRKRRSLQMNCDQ